MLKSLIEFKPGDTVTLIPNSGVQFLDFGFDRAAVARLSRGFAFVEDAAPGTVSIFPLEPGPDDSLVYRRPDGGGPITAHEDQIYQIGAGKVLDWLEGLWLPFPFFRRSGSGFDEGPTTWARVRLVRLDEPDEAGRTHRVVLAFDTLLTPRLPGQPYTAPEYDNDATEKVFFGFCSDHRRNSAFMALPWVAGWLKEQFVAGIRRDRRQADSLLPGEHWAAYMVLLDVIAATCPVPTVEFADIFSSYGRREPVGVSLVLDVGNSRMCGVLVEDAPGSSYADVSQTYRLELRDLSRIERVYSEPFESRVEFAATDFGPIQHASRSGRTTREAFWWPSPVRVGPEAARLAAKTDGTEGASGLSSPKRYLWDGAPRIQPWINNNANLPDGAEPQEIRGPMISRLTEDGTVTIGRPGLLPGLARRYARSSLYTLMLAELLIQAATQINSIDVRKNRLNSGSPRLLKQIILTLPTATPLSEQRILRQRVEAALALVWEVMGWSAGTTPVPKPKVRLDWDEATCTHLVWLFNEIQHKFLGTPKEFFDLVASARRSEAGDKSAIRVASIDIGGGTTDLMIMQHEIMPGTETVIEPRPVFREGFRLAGDDILKQLVEGYLLDALETAMTAAGVERAGALLSDFFGGDREAMSQRERAMRGQLVSQVLARAAIGLLRRYERGETAEDGPATIGELLAGVEVVAHPAIAHFEETVRLRGGAAYGLLATPIGMDRDRIEELVTGLVGPMIRDLCDLVRAYDCDVLLGVRPPVPVRDRPADDPLEHAGQRQPHRADGQLPRRQLVSLPLQRLPHLRPEDDGGRRRDALPHAQPGGRQHDAAHPGNEDEVHRPLRRRDVRPGPESAPRACCSTTSTSTRASRSPSSPCRCRARPSSASASCRSRGGAPRRSTTCPSASPMASSGCGCRSRSPSSASRPPAPARRSARWRTSGSARSSTPTSSAASAPSTSGSRPC